jgi:hypothetical protein
MDVGMDQALIRFTTGLLWRCRQAFLAEIVDGFIDLSPFSVNAFWQSRMPAPVFSRKFFYELTQTCHGFLS